MTPMLKLLSENRGRGKFCAESGAHEATLYLYDTIVSDDLTAQYFGGVSPQSFAKQLAAIEAPLIHLRINSPGGDVFAARAMEQAVREHPSKIVAHIDGVAASAASFLAIAASEVVMAEGAFFMIHKAWSLAYGNANDLLEMAALLEKVDGTMVDNYSKKTGQEKNIVAGWMAAETWFTAQECVDAGFADRIAVENTQAKMDWNLSAYAKAPPIKTQEQKTEKTEEPTAQHNTDHLRRKLHVITQAA